LEAKTYAKIAPMKIVILSSEATPFAKTGGLADVAGALPKFLSKLGLEVRLVMPLYREVRTRNLPLDRVLEDHPLDWGGRSEKFSVWQGSADSSFAFFIEKDEWYDRDYLYGTPGGDYPDNGQRFSFYSKAALETLQALDFAPDIIHGHDWQSAMALAILKFIHQGNRFFKDTRSLFTIHNLAYQGLFDKSILAEIGLPDSLFTIDGVEFFGKVNFLKAGILYATAVNTVSPRYSREIQTPEFGHGLDGLLRTRNDVLSGILNGADYSAWDPSRDPFLKARYGPSSFEGKADCKNDLLETFGLPLSRKDAPVIGMVSRLAGQKGLDILVGALEGLFRLGVTLIILGTGEEKIQEALIAARERYPSFFGLKIAFDDQIAHKIMAGCDMLLIPSRYEPCGLTQMYSFKYGTIPLVRATGGLDDSVREFHADNGQGNGFKFEDYSARALLDAVRRAIKAYDHKPSWDRLVQNAMAEDFSWDRSAREYLSLFKKIAGL
jgi:starch synthase